jgi:TetR/AcrR family tetracycline transcriptional repressor
VRVCLHSRFARVLQRALALVDREGLDSLTMRRLAQALKVSPMALYNHFAGKDELLRAMAEHLAQQIDFSCDHPDWRERIWYCFRSLRAVVRAHPASVRLMEALEEPPLAIFRPLDLTLQALGEAGVTGDDAFRVYFLLTNFTLGQASYEVRGPFKGMDPASALTQGRLGGGAFEHIERSLAFDDWDFDEAFEFGLSVILRGVEQLGRTPSSARRSK